MTLLLPLAALHHCSALHSASRLRACLIDPLPDAGTRCSEALLLSLCLCTASPTIHLFGSGLGLHCIELPVSSVAFLSFLDVATCYRQLPTPDLIIDAHGTTPQHRALPAIYSLRLRPCLCFTRVRARVHDC